MERLFGSSWFCEIPSSNTRLSHDGIPSTHAHCRTVLKDRLELVTLVSRTQSVEWPVHLILLTLVHCKYYSSQLTGLRQRNDLSLSGMMRAQVPRQIPYRAVVRYTSSKIGVVSVKTCGQNPEAFDYKLGSL